MGSEQRETPRFQGALPVVTECGKGITCNLSSSGVLFETAGSFSPGQSIEFSIVLNYLDPGHPVCLKCNGSIVRVEKKGERIGVAATIDAFSIVDYTPGKETFS